MTAHAPFDSSSRRSRQALSSSSSRPSNQALYDMSSSDRTLFNRNEQPPPRAPFGGSSRNSGQPLSSSSSQPSGRAFGRGRQASSEPLFGSGPQPSNRQVFGSSTQASGQSPFASNLQASGQSPFASSLQASSQSPYVSNLQASTQSPFASSLHASTQSPFASNLQASTQSPFASSLHASTQSPFASDLQASLQSPFASSLQPLSQSPFASNLQASSQSVFGSNSPASGESLFGSSTSASTQSLFGSSTLAPNQALFGSSSQASGRPPSGSYPQPSVSGSTSEPSGQPLSESTPRTTSQALSDDSLQPSSTASITSPDQDAVTNSSGQNPLDRLTLEERQRWEKLSRAEKRVIEKQIITWLLITCGPILYITFPFIHAVWSAPSGQVEESMGDGAIWRLFGLLVVLVISAGLFFLVGVLMLVGHLFFPESMHKVTGDNEGVTGSEKTIMARTPSADGSSSLTTAITTGPKEDIETGNIPVSAENTPEKRREWEDLSQAEQDRLITIPMFLISGLVLYFAVPDFFAVLSIQRGKTQDIMTEGLVVRLFLLFYAIVLSAATVLMLATVRLVCMWIYAGSPKRLNWKMEIVSREPEVEARGRDEA